MSIFSTFNGMLAGGEVYVANAVTFDGTNDYLEASSGLTLPSGQNTFIISIWFLRDTTGSTHYFMYGLNSGVAAYIFSINSSDQIRLRLKKAGTNQTIYEAKSSTTITDTNWHHVVISADLSNTGKRHFILDGVEDSPTYSTYTNDVLEHNTPDGFAVGATTSGTSKYDGDFSDTYYNLGEYLDLSVSSNLEKFRKDGKPVDLGSDGSKPTGTVPQIFLSGETATWHTNDGSGGGFTENGALTTASTNPGD